MDKLASLDIFRRNAESFQENLQDQKVFQVLRIHIFHCG